MLKAKILVFLLLSYFISGCDGCTAMRMYQDGQNTIVKELSPSALLKKYEWFKDASGALDAKVASLSDYQRRFNQMKSSYGEDSTKRAKWSRDDREQWNVWTTEIAGLESSYNDLASQYNAEMVKINYAFCNVGNLPEGAKDHPLPREYKPYIY